MKISYNKLWKLLIDKGMKKSQLREAVGASKSTFSLYNGRIAVWN